MNWFKSFLNEPGTKEGSSQRLMLVLLVITILVLVVYLTVSAKKLPEVPGTLQNMVEYLGSILVAGMAFGKGASAYRAAKGVQEVPGVDQLAQ